MFDFFWTMESTIDSAKLSFTELQREEKAEHTIGLQWAARAARVSRGAPDALRNQRSTDAEW